MRVVRIDCAHPPGTDVAVMAPLGSCAVAKAADGLRVHIKVCYWRSLPNETLCSLLIYLAIPQLQSADGR